jgi:hypothetical protein
MHYLLSLSLASNSIPARDKLVRLLRGPNQQRGLLIAALFEGKPTYSEFAAQRMKMGDQIVAEASGTASPRRVTEQALTAPLNIPLSPVITSALQLQEATK